MAEGNSGPGYAAHPGHRVVLLREARRVTVVFGGETIADSTDVVTVREADYPPVHYLPRRDVAMAHLARTSHTTYCPFKGKAAYFSLSVAGQEAANAVWSYETPYDEVVGLKERVAFYPSKVDAITVG